MSNKELAAQCLIEAANILNESAGRNALGKRLSDKGMLTPKAKESVDILDSHKKHVTEAMHSFGKTKKEFQKYLEACKRQDKEPKQSILDNFDRYNNKVKDTIEGARETNTQWKNAIERELSAHSKKAAPIHDKINRKAQNESVYDIFDDIDFSDILD